MPLFTAVQNVSRFSQQHSNQAMQHALLAFALVAQVNSKRALESWPWWARQSVQRIASNETLKVTRLASSAFAACELHSVRMPTGAVATDWIFFHERPHVNVLVRTKHDGLFAVFLQQKYAIPSSLAPVGGFIEDGESPEHAAKRELREELGLHAQRWQALGSFVTSANRGGGRIFAFFADDCVGTSTNAAGMGDAEHQSVVRLTRQELISAVKSNRFEEVKWTATVALALLSLPELPERL
jgi:ADP-ribose pyrophosphatase